MWNAFGVTFFRVSYSYPFFSENEGVTIPSQVSYTQLFDLELWLLACHMRFPAPAVHIDYSF